MRLTVRCFAVLGILAMAASAPARAAPVVAPVTISKQVLVPAPTVIVTDTSALEAAVLVSITATAIEATRFDSPIAVPQGQFVGTIEAPRNRQMRPPNLMSRHEPDARAADTGQRTRL